MSKTQSPTLALINLPQHFIGKGEVKGYEFRLLSKTDKAFIYEVSSSGTKHYEVFKYRINKRFSCISYPNSKAFGIWAWTKENLESALLKFQELNTYGGLH